MTVPVQAPWEVTNLQVQVSNTLAQIDCALDHGDRKAFRVWSGRYLSLTGRLANLLTRIVTSER
jgi:hypothetical protein